MTSKNTLPPLLLPLYWHHPVRWFAWRFRSCLLRGLVDVSIHVKYSRWNVSLGQLFCLRYVLCVLVSADMRNCCSCSSAGYYSLLVPSSYYCTWTELYSHQGDALSEKLPEPLLVISLKPQVSTHITLVLVIFVLCVSKMIHTLVPKVYENRLKVLNK